MEDARLVHAALGHQVMEIGVEIDPVPKGLDSGDDPRRKCAPGHNLEVTAQGPEGAAVEIAEETQFAEQPVDPARQDFSWKTKV
jgi:hypothetical protein